MSIQRRDSNPWFSERESLPITTRLLDFLFGLCIIKSHHRATPNFYFLFIIFISVKK